MALRDFSMASKDGANSSAKPEEMGDDEEFVPGYKDMATFSQASFKSIMGAIKTSNDLPSSGDDFDYYSSFETFRNLMDMEGTRMVQLMQKIMRYHGVRGNLATSSELRETEDKYDVLVDANDQLLERVGNCLDEAQGLRKQENPLVVASVSQKKNISGSWNKKAVISKGKTSSNFRLLAAKNIQRPQVRFKDKIDNSSRPFVPKIQYKPHALKSLSESLAFPESSMDSDNAEESIQFPHPYQYELDHFKPLVSQLEEGQIQEPKSLDDCPVALIDSVQELEELVKSLKSEKEVAVDLEHHSYRSFQGITCLMQLSTRTHDYLIDTIELRSDLHVLNEIFTDPKIVKVFHGADLDIDWLQRDLGLYVVNMFDTGQAARVLNLQRFALSYLLLTYCQVEADKQFQLADWRIRPLPEELIRYAREDTHYLLYIYDRLRTELISRGNDQKNLLLSVLQRSKQICEKRYEKPRSSNEQYMEFYKRSKKVFNSQQLAALKGLHTWRDALARMEDESIGYILPNHMLLQISEVLPREPQGILACCNPIPPLVRQNLIEMHNIIKDAKETPLVKPEPSRTSLKSTKIQSKSSPDSILNCPHDLSHQKQSKPSAVLLDKDAVPVAKFSSLFKDVADITLYSSKKKPSSLADTLSQKSQPAALMTDAQKKSAMIWAQFVNPIEKFLPSSMFERKGHGESKTLTQAEEKWILLPHTERPAVHIKEKPKIQVSQAAVAKEDMIAVADIEPDTEENPVSLRKQFPKTKTHKRDTAAADIEVKKPREEPSQSKAAKESNGKKQKSSFMKPDEDFQAYDYSKADYKGFAADGGKKKKDYNPDGESYDGKHKGSKGSKNKSFAGGKKSMTYHKGNTGITSKINWPKR